MKQIPKIEKVMTGMPDTIGADQKLSSAFDLMKKEQYRHLPVMDGGKLVGLLSDRDVLLVHAHASDQEFQNLKVEDAMSQDVFTVKHDSDLDAVVLEMASNKYGCAVVQQSNGKVIGIFTAIDGLRYLGELLQQRFHR